ncbi:extensin [Iris pallida]|uniref:Extensin n=1 Tax=Iris pallida TaxID=29817 RepID=A0AAX6G6H0_IRIPA|nr:extensin [Iris pallida]
MCRGVRDHNTFNIHLLCVGHGNFPLSDTQQLNQKEKEQKRSSKYPTHHPRLPPAEPHAAPGVDRRLPCRVSIGRLSASSLRSGAAEPRAPIRPPLRVR